MQNNKNIDIVYDLIDKKIDKLKPNYGYVEKYMVSDKILKYNNYLLPKNDEISDLLKLVINYG